MTDEPIDLATLAKDRNISRWSLNRLTSRGQIPSVAIDGVVHVRPSAFDAYVAVNGEPR